MFNLGTSDHLDYYEDSNLFFSIEWGTKHLYFLSKRRYSQDNCLINLERVHLPIHVDLSAVTVTTDPLVYMATEEGDIYVGKYRLFTII